MLPMRERSKTEEDILRAALRHGSRKTGSNPTSASDDSNGLEWENDFVSAEMDDNGNSEYAGFVNPVLELSDSGIEPPDTDQQKRQGKSVWPFLFGYDQMFKTRVYKWLCRSFL